ncbi:hypothetical protein [Nocardioides cynanchi]|uniref:hypothetical protein n=1 Tax=Nocardioides cynanchi TaxID=2558918 RepID=UPI0012439B5E|nr:hypothetical protein [Nocardioides cynanchi]
MQILWWLAPPVVATVLAMVWVAWLGRDGRGQVDREVAVRRLSEAMSRPSRPTRPARTAPARPAAQGERSTGVAVRPSSRPVDRTRRAS